MIKKYIILEPDVFIQIKGEKVLLYNSCNGLRLLYKDLLIAELFQRNITGLHAYPIFQHEIDNEIFTELIIQIENHNMGFMTGSSTAPIQFVPSLKIQNDYRNNSELFSENDNSLTNLHSMSVYLSMGGINQSNRLPHNAFKQLLCNIEQGAYSEMDFDRFRKTMHQILSLHILNRLDLLGGDLLSYSKFDELISFFKQSETVTNLFFYLDSESILMNEKKVKELLLLQNAKMVFCISKDSSIRIDEIFKIIPIDKIEINCFIEHEDDIAFFETLFAPHNVSYSLFPFFNGYNTKFFENNVFIQENDFDELMLTQNQILKNMTMNSMFYGKLIVFPNGETFTNVNTEKIGNIFNTPMVVLTKNEIMKDTSNWFLTRVNVEPCKRCLYNFLCPAISNYEFVFGKNNLCNISDNLLS